MVRPTRNGAGINLQANEFADFLEHKCINVALEVMGKVNWANFRSNAVLKDRTAPLQPETRVTLNPGGTVIPETEKLANLMGSRPNQAISRTDGSNAMTDDQDVGSVGRTYGLQQGRGNLDQAEQSLGLQIRQGRGGPGLYDRNAFEHPHRDQEGLLGNDARQIVGRKPHQARERLGLSLRRGCGSEPMVPIRSPSENYNRNRRDEREAGHTGEADGAALSESIRPGRACASQAADDDRYRDRRRSASG